MIATDAVPATAHGAAPAEKPGACTGLTFWWRAKPALHSAVTGWSTPALSAMLPPMTLRSPLRSSSKRATRATAPPLLPRAFWRNISSVRTAFIIRTSWTIWHGRMPSAPKITDLNCFSAGPSVFPTGKIGGLGFSAEKAGEGKAPPQAGRPADGHGGLRPPAARSAAACGFLRPAPSQKGQISPTRRRKKRVTAACFWQGAVSSGSFLLEPAQKLSDRAATLCILQNDMI